MPIKNTLPLTEARKNIFNLADAVQNSSVHFILTERGVPKAVVISAARFDELTAGRGAVPVLRDGDGGQYASGQAPNWLFSKTLIIRDESRVVYLVEDSKNAKYQEEGLIKSQLFVNLIESYGYPLNLVELGRYVKVGSAAGRKYIEADLIINDERGNVTTVFEVSAFADYEKNLERMAADLFDLAKALSWAKKPHYLIYFSRTNKNGDIREKISVIDFHKFNSFQAWKKAGRPCLNAIPRFGERTC